MIEVIEQQLAGGARVLRKGDAGEELRVTGNKLSWRQFDTMLKRPPVTERIVKSTRLFVVQLTKIYSSENSRTLRRRSLFGQVTRTSFTIFSNHCYFLFRDLLSGINK